MQGKIYRKKVAQHQNRTCRKKSRRSSLEHLEQPATPSTPDHRRRNVFSPACCWVFAFHPLACRSGFFSQLVPYSMMMTDYRARRTTSNSSRAVTLLVLLSSSAPCRLPAIPVRLALHTVRIRGTNKLAFCIASHRGSDRSPCYWRSSKEKKHLTDQASVAHVSTLRRLRRYACKCAPPSSVPRTAFPLGSEAD